MPSLPQNDTAENQANRKAQLENKQKQYVFDPEYLPPLTVIKDVPITESFSPKYLAERLPSTLAKLSANSLAIKVKSHWDPLDELQDYEDFYPVLPPPSVMRTYQMDESFAEQRLSGSNPMVLRAIAELPPTFSYSLQEVQTAYSPQIPDVKMVDGIITNFHQPNSTLLLLVSAMVGDDWQTIYEHALQNNYRFLSFGDSSLLMKKTNA